MSKGSTKEEFIAKAKKIHGDKYGYGLVNYENNHTKVKIICPIHGVFEQRPQGHLNGRGCPKCGHEKQKEARSTVKAFIENARKIHGDKYDYAEVEYKGTCNKVKIICPIHGVFEQRPIDHLRGHGCPKCGFERTVASRTLTTTEFIDKAKELWGDDTFDYSQTQYVNSHTKVEIKCVKHNRVFKQTPNDHLNGRNGCPKCSGKEMYAATSEFVDAAKEFWGNEMFDYSQVKYGKMRTKVKIKCIKHNLFFEQEPSNHLQGKNGCPECNKERLDIPKENFYKKIVPLWSDKYSFEQTNYINNYSKVKIRCLKHNLVFQQTPTCLMIGQIGCPECSSKLLSVGERKVKKYLDENFIKYERQRRVLYGKSRRENYGKMDFYLKNYGAIEFDGSQHFAINDYFGGIKGYEDRILKDSQKTSYCEKNNIPLLRIRYDQIDRIEEMIDDFIKNSEKYVRNHNTFLTNEEYYSIREDVDDSEESSEIKDLNVSLIKKKTV